MCNKKMPDWAFDVIDNFKYSFNVICYFGIINHLKLKLENLWSGNFCSDKIRRALCFVCCGLV